MGILMVIMVLDECGFDKISSSAPSVLTGTSNLSSRLGL